MNIERQSPPLRIYLAWLGAVIFFTYQYILRVLPGIIEPELRIVFSLTADEFSTLGSFFMFIYALVQIPSGVLLDRYGVKRITMVSLCFCIAGNLLLVHGVHLWHAQLSRVLTGLGSAAAYIGCMKIVADYLPNKQKGLFMGVGLAIGLLGPMFAAKPMVYLIESSSWRYVLNIFSIIGLGLIVILFFLMPTCVIDKKIHLYWKDVLKGLRDVLASPALMAFAIMTTVFYGPFGTIADLWGVTFLMNCFNFEREIAVTVAMQLYVGAAISSILIPWICDRLNINRQGIVLSYLLMMISFCSLLFLPHITTYTIVLCLLGIGVASSSEILCFSGAAHYTKVENSGMIMGVLNTVSVIGGAFLMQLIGFILDFQWDGSLDSDGLRYYQPQDYFVALKSVLLFILIFGCFALFLLLVKKVSDNRKAVA